MNSQMGFSSKLRRLTAAVECLRKDPRGARHWGASSRHKLHMRVGPVKARPYRCGGGILRGSRTSLLTYRLQSSWLLFANAPPSLLLYSPPSSAPFRFPLVLT